MKVVYLATSILQSCIKLPVFIITGTSEPIVYAKKKVNLHARLICSNRHCPFRKIAFFFPVGLVLTIEKVPWSSKMIIGCIAYFID